MFVLPGGRFLFSLVPECCAVFKIFRIFVFMCTRQKGNTTHLRWYLSTKHKPYVVYPVGGGAVKIFRFFVYGMILYIVKYWFCEKRTIKITCLRAIRILIYFSHFILINKECFFQRKKRTPHPHFSSLHQQLFFKFNNNYMIAIEPNFTLYEVILCSFIEKYCDNSYFKFSFFGMERALNLL